MSSPVNETASPKTSILQRAQELNDITDKYFRGEMSVDEFVAFQRKLGPDWESAFRYIAQRELVVNPEAVHDTATDERFRLRDLIRAWFHHRSARTGKAF